MVRNCKKTHITKHKKIANNIISVFILLIAFTYTINHDLHLPKRFLHVRIQVSIAHKCTILH